MASSLSATIFDPPQCGCAGICIGICINGGGGGVDVGAEFCTDAAGGAGPAPCCCCGGTIGVPDDVVAVGGAPSVDCGGELYGNVVIGTW